MSSIESFEEAARLDTAALRALLASARPEQRVWAIWALALRLGGDIAELARLATIEPNSGVRRILALVLASHGETDLLVALARHDPDLAVRESAIHHVTRLAAGGAIDPAVVSEAAATTPSIQIAILAAIDAHAPDVLVQLAEGLLETADESVQLEAFEALLRVDTPVGRAFATSWLRGADDQLALEACRRWTHAADAEEIAGELRLQPARIRGIALRQLHAPPWSAVERLVAHDAGLLAEVVERKDIDLPSQILGTLVVDEHCRSFVGRLGERLAELDDLPWDFAPLVSDLRRHCGQRMDALEAERVAAEEALAALHEREGRERVGAALDAAERRRAEEHTIAALLAELDRLASHRARARGMHPLNVEVDVESTAPLADDRRG
jgi:hypothetical protein